MNYMLGFILVAVFSSISAENKKRDETCETPNGNNGKCVPLNQCPIVYDGASSRNPTVLNYTQRSYCGYDEDTLVCCEHPGPVKSVDLGVLPDITICGRVQDEPRIWGGELTNLGEFPWMVSIYYKNLETGKVYNKPSCGGSLINEEFVLTAAHCLVNRDIEIDSVRLGEWDTTKDPDCVELVANEFCADPIRIVQVEEVISHPFYSKKTRLNDIGLIRLKEKVQFTDFIMPVCLSHPKLPPLQDNTKLTIAGWGKTENGTTSDVLLKVELPLISRTTCQTQLSHMRTPITLQQLCAGGESGKDSCQGDAGGPLMHIYENEQEKRPHWYQYGITSSGVGCGRAGYPAIYTKVSGYIDWIVNVISQYN